MIRRNFQQRTFAHYAQLESERLRKVVIMSNVNHNQGYHNVARRLADIASGDAMALAHKAFKAYPELRD